MADHFLSSYKSIHVFRDTELCRVELVEHESDGSYLIKRTYFEDKREIFHLLRKADCRYLTQIQAVYFHLDTVIYEEYIEGETLRNFLTQKTMTPRQAEDFLKELLYAVDAVHKLGIIHRDIKPENILIDKCGHVHLIDFGIARIYRPNETRDTQLLGTVGYAPPEQFGFSQSDFRTDIYAIGMTCRDIAQAYKTRPLFKKIIKKCTQIDSEQRYSDVDSILSEFKRRGLYLWGILLSAILLTAILFVSICLFRKPEQKALPGNEKEISQDRKETSEDTSLEEGYNLNKLFTGHDEADGFLLQENMKERKQFSFKGLEKPVDLEAELTSEGVNLHIKVSGTDFDFQLFNQYEVEKDFSDTSLYAEILIYDLDHNGRDEVWVAISDRMNITMPDGTQDFHQNYMAGFGIYCNSQGSFSKIEEQLLTEGNGNLDLDGIVPHGIWQNQEMMGYLLKDDKLEYVQ